MKPSLYPWEVAELRTLADDVEADALEVFGWAGIVLGGSLYRLSLPSLYPCNREPWEQFSLFMKGRAPAPGIDLPAPFLPRVHPCRRREWIVIDPDAVVTRADGFEKLSDHQHGRALDPVLRYRHSNEVIWHPGPNPETREVFLLVVAEFKSLGYRWGGDWPRPDYPHIYRRG